MFAYCGNNPVSRADNTGTLWRIAIVAAIAFILGGCSDDSVPEEPYSGAANCYAYALKQEYDPAMGKPFLYEASPGCFSGNPLTHEDFRESNVMKNIFCSRMHDDAKSLGYFLREVDSPNHATGSDSWLIALVYSEEYGFHFYRRGENGTWSHKQGQLEILYTDYSGNIILDPQICNRGGYTEFYGYYEVGILGG